MVSMAGLASLILLSLGRVICFTSLSQISPSLTRVRSLCSTSLFRKIRNPQKTDLSPPQSTYKKYDNKCHRIFYGVDKLLNMEPSNNNISQMYIAENLCTELVLLMKQSTQEYYNMRITLGLECI